MITLCGIRSQCYAIIDVEKQKAIHLTKCTSGKTEAKYSEQKFLTRIVQVTYSMDKFQYFTTTYIIDSDQFIEDL